MGRSLSNIYDKILGVIKALVASCIVYLETTNNKRIYQNVMKRGEREREGRRHEKGREIQKEKKEGVGNAGGGKEKTQITYF